MVKVNKKCVRINEGSVRKMWLRRVRILFLIGAYFCSLIGDMWWCRIFIILEGIFINVK